MELTQQDKARIFAMYLGSDINTSINGTVLDCDWLEQIIERDCDAQLILQDLSDISDEDAIEVCSITDAISNTGLIVERSYNCIRVFDRYNDTAFSSEKDGIVEFHYDSLDLFYWSEGKLESSDMERYLRMIDYLRSKSYMIPYMGINLFDAGIAIRKTKTA